MVGNFIGDHVKGSDFLTYPDEIAKGILLHRFIDDFTDHHPIALETVKLIQPVYGRYAGAVSDMLYDHYLAKNFKSYSTLSLPDFEDECYTNLFHHYSYLPDRVKNFLPKMKAARRLESYAHMNGILESLQIMSRFTSISDHTNALRSLFPKVDQQIEYQFITFFNAIENSMGILRQKALNKLEAKRNIN